MQEIIMISLIVTVCSFIQGFSGFAFSLVLFPLLAFYIPYNQLVMLNMILSFVLNLNVFIQIRKHSNMKKLLPLIIPACIFTIIASTYIDDISETGFKIFIGSLLIISVILNVLKFNLKIKNYQKYYPIVGSFSGALNGISGIGGPPLIIYFQNVDLPKMEYKSMFNKIFLSLNIVAITSFIIQGFIDVETVKLSFISIIFVVIGSTLGLKLSEKVSEKMFKKVLLLIILLMGINMIVGAL